MVPTMTADTPHNPPLHLHPHPRFLEPVNKVTLLSYILLTAKDAMWASPESVGARCMGRDADALAEAFLPTLTI